MILPRRHRKETFMALPLSKDGTESLRWFFDWGVWRVTHPAFSDLVFLYSFWQMLVSFSREWERDEALRGVHCSAYATLHFKLREWSEVNSFPENILAKLPRSLFGGAASAILIRTGLLLPPSWSLLRCVLQRQFPVGSVVMRRGKTAASSRSSPSLPHRVEGSSRLVKVNLSVKQTTLQTGGAPVTSEGPRSEPRPSHLAPLLPTTLGTRTRCCCVCKRFKD